MKRKETPKPENAKVINTAILEEILGGVQPAGGAGPKGAVIEQPPFSSFYHS